MLGVDDHPNLNPDGGTTDKEAPIMGLAIPHRQGLLDRMALLMEGLCPHQDEKNGTGVDFQNPGYRKTNAR